MFPNPFKNFPFSRFLARIQKVVDQNIRFRVSNMWIMAKNDEDSGKL